MGAVLERVSGLPRLPGLGARLPRIAAGNPDLGLGLGLVVRAQGHGRPDLTVLRLKSKGVELRAGHRLSVGLWI